MCEKKTSPEEIKNYIFLGDLDKMFEKCGKRQSEYKSYNSGLSKRKTDFQITNFAFNTPGCFR